MPSSDQIRRCKWERTWPAPQNWPPGRNARRNARPPTLHGRQWRPVLLGWIEREGREAECWVGADQGLSGNRQPSTLGRNDRPNNGSTTDGTGIAQRPLTDTGATSPDRPAAGVGSSVTQTAQPRMRFVFLGSELCLGLPPDPHLTVTPLPAADMTVGTTASGRGLAPPSDCPCRAH
jgi:hypothetical protein